MWVQAVWALVCLAAIVQYGGDAVIPLVLLSVFGSVLAAFLIPGRSADEEELQEEREGVPIPGTAGWWESQASREQGDRVHAEQVVAGTAVPYGAPDPASLATGLRNAKED